MRPNPGCAILLCITAFACRAQGPLAKPWERIGSGGGGTTYFPTVSSHDQNGGLFASDGKTWRALFTQVQHVYDVTIDPHHPDTLYFTGSDTAEYRSTDRGAHWQRIKGYDFKQGNRTFLDPNDAARIYITTYGGGVWHGPAAGAADPPEAVLTRIPVAR